jgi:hypothetical protein
MSFDGNHIHIFLQILEDNLNDLKILLKIL